MRITTIIFFICLGTLCYAQKNERDSMFTLVRKQAMRLDSLCDRIGSQSVRPRFVFPGPEGSNYFGKAKVKYYCASDKKISHKVKVRHANGFRYKKDIYYYEKGQKIKMLSVNDQVAAVLWIRSVPGKNETEKIKMVRLDDSTMVWNSQQESLSQ